MFLLHFQTANELFELYIVFIYWKYLKILIVASNTKLGMYTFINELKINVILN
jgi:hypothetical protein